MTTPRRVALLALGLAALSLSAGRAYAFEPFTLQVPCTATAENEVGTVRPCITCHDNADGGSGCATPPCLNAFGTDFDTGGRAWSAALAAMDSDGDGYTNGEELGDPDGTWTVGDAAPATCGCATRPGFDTFTPGDTDADGDGYCCVGQDTSGDGDCLDAGEHDGTQRDCDESDDMVHTGRAELCTNAIDNDCDGLATLLDDECADVVDRDGDGFCPMGRDDNRDRDCNDAGEMTSDVDCDDDEPTVSPAAREFCVDSLDNDCDGDVDLDDSECTSDTDADSDGYCPIGRDLDGDGDCNDAGEIDAGFDCDDSVAEVNPGATEVCTDFADNDCDGFADFRDEEDCGAFFDADGDGYCPAGRDGNGNGNCTDAGETDDPGDCDDDDPAISPGMGEICTNGSVDDDCDGAASLADDDCEGYLDGDGDTYCFVGIDIDRDGDCADEGEATGEGDCDESTVDVNPSVAEVCTDGVDNDCNGTADAADRVTCFEYRDHDGDGWCWVGEDRNGDGDCADAGEQGEPREWRSDEDPAEEDIDGDGSEFDATRYPGAPEHCDNRVDEDLDGMVDEAGYCTSDEDADGDGWCPIGRDDNGDGDCLDEGENRAEFDCNDGATDVNPGEDERCLELVDADCDGQIAGADSDCLYLRDLDGDGVCGSGVDDNGDGDCLDTDEQRFGEDCDDDDPTVSSRARESCGDGIDNDCNGDVDYDDRACTCEMDAECDDGDACTVDRCTPDGTCENAPDPRCADGGMVDGGMGSDAEDDCNCAAVGAGHGPGASLWGWLAALAFIGWRRRRRAR
ncbi:MAG TPA: MopE-related protein [Sandaracinaceae bacterium LLY-WYZ-13_1]|nr:MopE-related protein [Sandaracinaceae bacterium LLY-WYZ-13_1]